MGLRWKPSRRRLDEYQSKCREQHRRPYAANSDQFYYYLIIITTWLYQFESIGDEDRIEKFQLR